MLLYMFVSIFILKLDVFRHELSEEKDPFTGNELNIVDNRRYIQALNGRIVQSSVKVH